MWKPALRCLSFLLVFSFVLAARKEDKYYPRKDGILVLDDHCFYAALLKYKFVLVFYHDKSKESTTAAEFLPQIESKLHAENPDVHVGMLDVERESESLRKFPVYEMPAFRLFKNGRKFDFHGTKTVEHILTWINLAMNVPIQINVPKELDELRDTTCVIVGCFPGGKPDDAMVNFRKVSEYFVYDPRMQLPRFALVTSASLARSLSLTSGSVTVFKKFEDGQKAVYDGDATHFDKLLKFVEEETTPVVFKHDEMGYNSKLHDTSVDYQHILFCSSKESNYRQTFNNFKEAAKKYRGDSNIIFVHVDTSHDRTDQYVGFYHVDPKKDLPCNRMTKIDKYHSRFVPAKQDFSTEGFVRFTDDVMNGKVQRNVRSDPSPSDWNKDDVKVLVGSTYDKFVKDEQHVVFMIYYVPDNDACSTALGVFNQLAREMRSNQTMLFGKMNVATNDGEIDVHISYPTFKLFRKNGEVMKYRGEVSVGAMKAFLETGGSAHLSGDQTEHHGGAEYDFSWHDKAHPIDDWRDEEERKRKWAEEEKEILEKAVEHHVGEEPHDNPKYKEEHPLKHLDPEERDEEHMDPKKHADFENHPYQPLETEHDHVEL